MRFKIPKMSYKQKTLRNIVMMLLLLVFVWINDGCPLPTEELAFRRAERQHLLGRSEILLHLPDGTRAHLFVGRGDGYVIAAEGRKDRVLNLSYWSLEGWEGVQLISSPGFYACHCGPPHRTCRGVLALQMPEGARRAELTVETFGTVYRGEGEPLDNGVWLFHMNDGQNAPYGCPYKLVVYGTEDRILLKQDGELRKPDYE